jgi:hypothetical protein
MLDGNEDMRRGPLARILHSANLREVIMEKHGTNAPSTYRRNTNNVPIDGIWASRGIVIQSGGYCAYDEIISGTDHTALWIDISYKTAFGHDGSAPIIRPSARQLNNQNPYIRVNFNTRCLELSKKFSIGKCLVHLELNLHGAMTQDQISEYITIDKIRRHHIKIAEAKCRKF